MKKKQVFISLSYKRKDFLEEVLNTIETLLKKKGLEPLIFAHEYVLEGEDYPQMMQATFKEIENSRFVIAELSHKAIGVGIEIGYAKARGIPVIYLRKEGSELSTTVKGTAEVEIKYSNLTDLEDKLRKEIAIL